MGIDRKSVLRKLADSQAAGGGGTPLRDGRGRLCVKKISLETGFNGLRLVINTIVVASSPIPVVSLKTGQPLNIVPNQPGTDADITFMLEKHKGGFGYAMGFILPLFGETGEVDKEELFNVLDEVTDERNQAQGMLIDYSTYRKVSQEKGIEMTLANFYNVPKQDVNAYRKWIESITLGQQQQLDAQAVVQ